jgi:hypothetical protein
MSTRSCLLARGAFLFAITLVPALPAHHWLAPQRESTAADAAATERISGQYGQLPLSFERNEGQTDGRVEFLSRGFGYALFLAAGGEAVFVLAGTGSDDNALRAEGSAAVANELPPAATGAVLRLRLVGARAEAHAVGREPLPGPVNYLRGADRAGWRTGIRAYARVAYADIYDGIDLVYYGNRRQLEYDLVVKPGTDPRVITMEVDGADRIDIDDSGDLVLHVGARQVRQRRPVVYQERHGVREVVEGRYVLQGSRRVAFHVGAYDPALALVIDPVLVYSTYLGGSFGEEARDEASGVAADAAGLAYVVGTTISADFPTTSGAYDTTTRAREVFVTKLDASGTTLVYSTFLGGSSNDFGSGIAVDALGHAYVTGFTGSADFPTTPGSHDRSLAGIDAFVTKLDPSGTALLYSTLLGGSGEELYPSIAVDSAGQAYVAGETDSSDFPTTPGAYATTAENDGDVFVTKLGVTGATLTYSTYVGGWGFERLTGIAVDPLGQVHIVGATWSADFPTTPGAFDTSYAGQYGSERDDFVTKLDSAGAMLVYSTYFGDGENDSVAGVAIDHLGLAVLAGRTESPDFPVTPGAFDTTFGGPDEAFVTKLDAAGVTLAYSTFLGGSATDGAVGIGVGPLGDIYVVGLTASPDFPLTP